MIFFYQQLPNLHIRYTSASKNRNPRKIC